MKKRERRSLREIWREERAEVAGGELEGVDGGGARARGGGRAET